MSELEAVKAEIRANHPEWSEKDIEMAARAFLAASAQYAAEWDAKIQVGRWHVGIGR
jgi:hypothetical protein